MILVERLNMLRFYHWVYVINVADPYEEGLEKIFRTFWSKSFFSILAIIGDKDEPMGVPKTFG